MGTTNHTFNLSGKRLGPYRVLHCIGKGGMGEVYEAYEESLERKVALKVLHPPLAMDEEYVKRFQREARAAARLDHPNIVAVYAVGQHEGIHYIAMQYVRGANLAKILQRKGTLSIAEALSIARSVAEALDEAHSHNMVHRHINTVKELPHQSYLHFRLAA